ncbi:hypothetical protein [Methylobacterium oryzae]|uniref:hypothetical protein n=1 Tax=Methylobacterium oryzae TaxID=334852 RepID=UPI002F35730A
MLKWLRALRGDPKNPMRPILTADQFVAGVIAVLALQNRRHFELTQTDLDKKFEKAFEDLLENEKDLKIRTNFTFYSDQLHSDSVSFRDTLLAAREKGIISMNNPTHQTFTINLDDARAAKYLKRIPLPSSFLSKLVERYFSEVGR